MFNILQYQHDQVSDMLTIKVVFQLKATGHIISDGGTFTTKRQGDAWLHNVKRDYFTIKIENYLLHKKHIIESGPGHKSLSEKKIALDVLMRFNHWAAFEKPALQEISRWVQEMEPHLEKILPSQNNNSYESSRVQLREIIEFAKQHHNGALLKKAS